MRVPESSQLVKLPKWAFHYIRQLEDKVETLSCQVEAIKEDDDSDAWLRVGIDGYRGLGKRPNVVFVDHRYHKGISVRTIGNGIEVMGAGMLVLRGRASNVFEIEVEDR